MRDVRPEDEGVYTCSAENLLEQVNASAKLTIQSKLSSLHVRALKYFVDTRRVSRIHDYKRTTS